MAWNKNGGTGRGLHLVGLLLCFTALVCDGYNLMVVTLAMPAIATEWKLQGIGSFGPVFTAGILGIMIGAPLFGGVADRIGRKKTFIFSLFIFSISSLAIFSVSSLSHLVILRFVTGLGLGGTLPLGTVISAELTPLAWRARVVAIVGSGATLGAAVSGFSTSWLLPHFGWRSLFVVGGLAPIAVGILSMRFLPETADHLLRAADRPTLAPAQQTPDASLVKSTFRDLFRGPLAFMTPVLWMLFIIVGMANYFIFSWAPTLYTGAGYSIAQVAIVMGLFGTLGTIGGLLIGWPIDRFGVGTLTVVLLLAVPVVASLALVEGSLNYLTATMAAAGFLLLPLQVGLNGIATMTYPTNLRAMGVGLGLGTVRLGQILGALGGGVLVGMGLQGRFLFPLLAGILVVAAAGSALLAHLKRPSGRPPGMSDRHSADGPQIAASAASLQTTRSARVDQLTNRSTAIER